MKNAPLLVLALLFFACASAPEKTESAGPPEEQRTVEADDPGPDVALDISLENSELTVETLPEAAEPVSGADEPDDAVLLPPEYFLLSARPVPMLFTLPLPAAPNIIVPAAVEKPQPVAAAPAAAPAKPQISFGPDFQSQVPVPQPEPAPAPPVQAPPPDPVPDIIIPVEAEPAMVFSRTVRATVGQLVEVPFRGTGWVFLGEDGARRGIVYDSRRLDPDGQSFIFRTENAGVYVLKFYRQDFIRNYILNDFVRVIVGAIPESAGSGWFNPSIDTGRVIAEPRWPAAAMEAPAAAPAKPAAVTQPPAAASQPAAAAPPQAAANSAPAAAPAPAQPTVATQPPVAAQPPAAEQPPVSRQPSRPPVSADEGIVPVRPPAAAVSDAPLSIALPANSPPDAFIARAREEYNAGRIASAVSILDQFCILFPSGSDEAWWLYGQCYEANSSSRNILSALDYYRRLTRDYPQSGRATEAQRRISYLERYYINIQ